MRALGGEARGARGDVRSPRALLDRSTRATPMGRIGLLGDIAGAVALLCSPDAAWITGRVIIAAGGLSAV